MGIIIRVHRLHHQLYRVQVIRRAPTIWKDDLHKGAEVVARLVSTVEVEDEESIKEAIKATAVVEEAAVVFSPEDPPPILRKKPSNSKENTISTKQMKNSKKCLKSYRKVQ